MLARTIVAGRIVMLVAVAVFAAIVMFARMCVMRSIFVQAEAVGVCRSRSWFVSRSSFVRWGRLVSWSVVLVHFVSDRLLRWSFSRNGGCERTKAEKEGNTQGLQNIHCFHKAIHLKRLIKMYLKKTKI